MGCVCIAKNRKSGIALARMSLSNQKIHELLTGSAIFTSLGISRWVYGNRNDVLVKAVTPARLETDRQIIRMTLVNVITLRL